MRDALRAATAADADIIGAIARAAYAKYVPRIGQAPAPMLADFAAHIARDEVVVIESEGQLRGFMIAWPETHAYLIDNIAVEPAAQGRGLGRRLIEHALSEARRFGLRALCLYTNVTMTENRRTSRCIAGSVLSRRTALWRTDLIGSICAGTFCDAAPRADR